MERLRNKYYKTVAHSLLLFVCVIVFIITGLPDISYADTEAEIVRVGYYENEVFQEGATKPIIL